jgi:hypothetical protein
MNLPLPKYRTQIDDKMVLCASEVVKEEPQINSDLRLDDYDSVTMKRNHNYSMNKSIEPLTKNNSIGNLQNKNSIQELLGSNNLMQLLKNHIKRSNRYKSNIRVDNSMPYQMNEQYKDMVFENRLSESSLRSISDRGSVINNKLRAGKRIKRRFDTSRKDYLFQSQDSNKNTKSVIKFKNSLQHDALLNSQKRLDKNESTDAITLNKNTILDSPAYKQQNSKNMLKYYNKSVKQTLTKNNHNKINDLL